MVVVQTEAGGQLPPWVLMYIWIIAVAVVLSRNSNWAVTNGLLRREGVTEKDDYAIIKRLYNPCGNGPSGVLNVLGVKVVTSELLVIMSVLLEIPLMRYGVFFKSFQGSSVSVFIFELVQRSNFL